MACHETKLLKLQDMKHFPNHNMTFIPTSPPYRRLTHRHHQCTISVAPGTKYILGKGADPRSPTQPTGATSAIYLLATSIHLTSLLASSSLLFLSSLLSEWNSSLKSYCTSDSIWYHQLKERRIRFQIPPADEVRRSLSS